MSLSPPRRHSEGAISSLDRGQSPPRNHSGRERVREYGRVPPSSPAAESEDEPETCDSDEPTVLPWFRRGRIYADTVRGTYLYRPMARKWKRVQRDPYSYYTFPGRHDLLRVIVPTISSSCIITFDAVATEDHEEGNSDYPVCSKALEEKHAAGRAVIEDVTSQKGEEEEEEVPVKKAESSALVPRDRGPGVTDMMQNLQLV